MRNGKCVLYKMANKLHEMNVRLHSKTFEKKLCL
jgi:hypothetical protein